MRWLLVAILAYACLVVQTAAFRPGSLAVEFDGHWARPDLVLLLGLFFALAYEPKEVFVLAWALGMASDVVNVNGRLGILALAFCLVLFLVSHVAASIPRTRLLAQFFLSLAVVFVVHTVWYIATRLLAGSSPLVLQSMEEGLLNALYSAVLAPYLFWAMNLLRTPLATATEFPRE